MSKNRNLSLRSINLLLVLVIAYSLRIDLLVLGLSLIRNELLLVWLLVSIRLLSMLINRLLISILRLSKLSLTIRLLLVQGCAILSLRWHLSVNNILLIMMMVLIRWILNMVIQELAHSKIPYNNNFSKNKDYVEKEKS